MYSGGHGVEEDQYRAVKYYESASNGKNAEAMAYLSGQYLHGKGVKHRNFGEALKWARRSYASGFKQAKEIWEQFDQYLAKNLDMEWDELIDLVDDVFASYKPSATNSHYPVEYDDFYPYVISCWLAAQEGVARAQLMIGDMYACGLGVSVDTIEAEYWYQKAGEQGNAQAYFCMGTLQAYEMTLDEYTVYDLENVMENYQKAIELGLKNAEKYLEIVAYLRDMCEKYYDIGYSLNISEEEEVYREKFKVHREDFENKMSEWGAFKKFSLWDVNNTNYE